MFHTKLGAALLCSLELLFACSAPVAVPTPSGEGGAVSGSAGTGDAGDAGDASALIQGEPDWCAARAVLQAKCQRCHGEPAENGAPFPLLTYADTQVADRKGAPRYEKLKAAIEAEYMPPLFLQLTPAVEPLTADESATLLTWLSGQPPLDAPHCE